MGEKITFEQGIPFHGHAKEGKKKEEGAFGGKTPGKRKGGGGVYTTLCLS